MPFLEIILTNQVIAFLIIGIAVLIIFLINQIQDAKSKGEKKLTDKLTEWNNRMEVQRLQFANETAVFEKQKEKDIYESANELNKRFETLTLNLERAKIEKDLTERFIVANNRWRQEEEQKIRADAKSRVQTIKFGQLTENLVPFGEEFDKRGFNPKDARFLGNPVDFILFDGLEEGKEEITIYFIEVKTGKSGTNENQRRIARAIISNPKRVEWLLVRTPKVDLNQPLGE